LKYSQLLTYLILFTYLLHVNVTVVVVYAMCL